jgi:hypothetical protein
VQIKGGEEINTVEFTRARGKVHFGLSWLLDITYVQF